MSNHRGCSFCNDTGAAFVWGMDDTGPDRTWWRASIDWTVCVECHADAMDGTEHLIIDRANALQTLEPIENYTAEDLEPLRAQLADSIAYWIEHRTTYERLE